MATVTEEERNSTALKERSAQTRQNIQHTDVTKTCPGSSLEKADTLEERRKMIQAHRAKSIHITIGNADQQLVVESASTSSSMKESDNLRDEQASNEVNESDAFLTPSVVQADDSTFKQETNMNDMDSVMSSSDIAQADTETNVNLMNSMVLSSDMAKVDNDESLQTNMQVEKEIGFSEIVSNIKKALKDPDCITNRENNEMMKQIMLLSMKKKHNNEKVRDLVDKRDRHSIEVTTSLLEQDMAELLDVLSKHSRKKEKRKTKRRCSVM